MKGLPKGQKGLPKGQKGLPKGQKGLPKGQKGQMGGTGTGEPSSQDPQAERHVGYEGLANPIG